MVVCNKRRNFGTALKRFEKVIKQKMKKPLIALLVLFCTMGVWAKTTKVVWEKPATEFGSNYGDGYFNLSIDVTKVELNETETKVFLTASLRSDYPDFKFQFAEETYLMANGVKYPAVSADGIDFGIPRQTDNDGKHDIILHFKPLPVETQTFDLISGDGDNACRIMGIMPKEKRHLRLFPSYWRNENTGNWDIAFFDNGVVYDCKFWNYKTVPNLKDTAGKTTFTICNGKEELDITVGKDRKGKRTIQTGNKKALYSMITGRFLPDYPTKDTRTGFTDTENKEDTVTVTGWLKDMPENFKDMKTFDFNISNIFTGGQDTYYGNLDSLGRFTIKIPLINSTELTCDWGRCFIRTVVEPGMKYFLMYDFKEGRRFFMGDDVRLQNELLKYPLDWKTIRIEKGGNFDNYIASVDSLLKTLSAKLDQMYAKHPMLSTRFCKYRKGNTLWQQAGAFGQARFNMPEFRLPPNARKYANTTFWKKTEKPYTLHRDWDRFVRDFIDDATDNVMRGQRFKSEEEYLLQKVKANINVLDSLGADSFIKGIRLSKMLYDYIDWKHAPISRSIIDSAKSCIPPAIMERVVKLNDKYIALSNKEFDKLVLKSNDSLTDISEGEAILKKIIEPFRGKLVLLDVWGTWCVPCKLALSNSAEEYARLAPYDIAYIYLANNSPRDSWENVIKEYNVTGNNVAHYNLPREQQDAVERYLKVTSYPTYKLFNKNGNLLDIQADPRNLDRIEELIRKLNNQ